MSARWVRALVAVGALACAGCGGDDSVAVDKPGATNPDAPGGGDASVSPSPEPVPGTASGEADCEEVKEDLLAVSTAAVILPQLDASELADASAITDETFFGDPEGLLAAIERLRPLVGDEAAQVLDALQRGVELVRRGRSGDADAAAAELGRLTGGVEGSARWLVEVSKVTLDVAATTGCELG